MKNILMISVLLLVGWGSYGQGWEWMRGAYNGQTHGARVSTDINGNVYAAGACWFNGQIGMYPFFVGSLSSTPLVKYDSLGNIKWVILADTSQPCGLTTDLFGNEYLMAFYWGTSAVFGGHTIYNPHPDSPSCFIAKINSAGSVLWMKNVGNINVTNTLGHRKGNCITTDACGNVYIACTFIETIIIGGISFPNVGTEVVPTSDILIAKYDSLGNNIWANTFGGNSTDWATGISVTHDGHIYIAGLFNSDTLKFGSDILKDTLTSVLRWNSFVAKLDALGNPLWGRTSKGTLDCELAALTTDSFGNVFVTGSYAASNHAPAALSFGSVTLPTVSTFQYYTFLIKFDNAGNAIWGKCVREKSVQSYAITMDPCYNVWILGATLHQGGNAVINDTIDGHVLAAPSINMNPVFIAGWSNSGTYITSSALASGSTGSWPAGIASDRSGNIYIMCDTQIDTFIVAGDSLYNTISSGHILLNMYVAKYNPGLGCPYETVPVVNCKVGINELDFLPEISLFPNPANTECTITYNGILPPNAGIAVYDLTGRLMHTYPLTGTSTIISIQDLLPGMYHCRIDAGQGIVSRKLVVVR